MTAGMRFSIVIELIFCRKILNSEKLDWEYDEILEEKKKVKSENRIQLPYTCTI